MLITHNLLRMHHELTLDSHEWPGKPFSRASAHTHRELAARRPMHENMFERINSATLKHPTLVVPRHRDDL